MNKVSDMSNASDVSKASVTFFHNRGKGEWDEVS